MRILLLTLAVPLLNLPALTYKTRSGEADLDFQFDVPPGWESYTGLRKTSRYASFHTKDSGGHASIEVYSYRAENANLDQLLLQQRARLSVAFDKVFLQSASPAFSREQVRRQVWTAYRGKKQYKLVTSFIKTEDRVLKIFCIATAKSYRRFESAFENSLLSFGFTDGKIGADAERSESTRPEVMPVPQPKPVKKAEAPVSKPARKSAPPNPAATKNLLTAVKGRDLPGVKRAVEQKADVNTIDAEGNSPLTYAVEQHDEQLIQFLREHGALDAAAGRRMLIAIAENNQPRFYGALDESPNPNFADKNGNTPLIVAAAYGNTEITQILLDMKVDVNAVDRDGYSALFYAAQEGHLRVLEKLVGAGAEVNLKSRFGFTPLHVAALRGQAKAVERLIRSGANVNAVAAGGGTAAYWAALNKYDDIVTMLTRAGAADPVVNRELAEAALTNDVGRAEKALRSQTVNIDMADFEGNSALFYALNANSTEVAKLLIESGSRPEQRSREGYTPLMLAAAQGNAALVQLLLKERKLLDAKDRLGRTALMLAAWKGHAAVVERLLAAKADLNAQDKDGWSPLMFAAFAGQSETARLLLGARAKTRLKNSSLMTAADIASQQGAQQITQAIQAMR
jgi:ankyrin repeat protein